MGVSMRRVVAVGAPVLLACVLSSPAGAQERTDTARVHVVRPGDTLWDLARQYLADPFLWPRIYQANRDEVEDPHWIFPRERLLIPGLSRVDVLGFPAAGDEPLARRQVPGPPPRTVFFPQPGLEGRTLIGAGDVPSPAVAPGEFYGAGVLTAQDRVQPLGRVAEVLSPTVLPVDPPVHALPYEKVFMVIEVPGTVRRGDRLHLIREGRVVRPFGRIYESTGIAQVLEIDGSTATLEVQEHFDAVAVGNLAVPLAEYSVPVGVRPVPAAPGIFGHLVAFQVPQPVYSEHDLGFVDLGRASGVTEGDVLEVVLPAERRSWGTRPEVVVARLQVVRVAERTSAVQVVSVEYPAIEPGLPVRVIAKMPSP